MQVKRTLVKQGAEAVSSTHVVPSNDRHAYSHTDNNNINSVSSTSIGFSHYRTAALPKNGSWKLTATQISIGN